VVVPVPDAGHSAVAPSGPRRLCPTPLQAHRPAPALQVPQKQAGLSHAAAAVRAAESAAVGAAVK
jgi:hypothetical protein